MEQLFEKCSKKWGDYGTTQKFLFQKCSKKCSNKKHLNKAK